jgi:hypothetical protein
MTLLPATTSPPIVASRQLGLPTPRIHHRRHFNVSAQTAPARLRDACPVLDGRMTMVADVGLDDD